MDKLHRNDLLSLEEYAAQRNDFRSKVMAHKDRRIAKVGSNVRLFFEDRFTIQYQVQEMLRAERIFEAAGIQEELDAYNPLIPDVRNWKATMMIEFPDEAERHRELARLIGIEDRTWVQVEGFERVYAIADEDLERETAEKTSSVHFLKFELGEEMTESLKSGAALNIGIDHEHYRHSLEPASAALREALLADLD